MDFMPRIINVIFKADATSSPGKKDRKEAFDKLDELNAAWERILADQLKDTLQ